MFVVRIPETSEDLIVALGGAGVSADQIDRLRSGESGVIAIGFAEQVVPGILAAVEKLAERRPKGRPKAIDADTVESARKLIGGGRTLTGAATELGVDKSTLSRAIGPSGHRGRQRALTPGQVELARHLRFQQKWSNQRIADELGCGEATVRRMLKVERPAP